MHVPMVGDELEAESIGTEGIFEASRRFRTRLVEVILGEGVQERHCRPAHPPPSGERLVERRVLADVPARVLSVEGLLPPSQRILLTSMNRRITSASM